MKITYKIYKEEGLLLRYFYGKFDVNELERHSELLLHDKNLKHVKKVLNDLSGLSDNFSFNNLKELLELNPVFLRLGKLTVFIVKTPLLTAFSHLYQMELSKNNYKCEYCSTEERAIRYLHLSDGFCPKEQFSSVRMMV